MAKQEHRQPTLAELIPITTLTHVQLSAKYPDNTNQHGDMFVFGWQLKEVLDPYEVDVTPIKDTYIYRICNDDKLRLDFHFHSIGEMRANVRFHDETIEENNRLIRIFVEGSKESRNFRGEYYLTGKELKALGVTELGGSILSRSVKDESIYHFPADHMCRGAYGAFANDKAEKPTYVASETYDSIKDLVDDVRYLNSLYASYKKVYKALDKQYEKRCKDTRKCTTA